MLNTGRVLYHWHGGTINRRVAALVEQMSEVPVLVHPRDAGLVGISDGDSVVVRSRRGKLTGQAVLTDAVREGSVLVPFVKLQESAANFLTNNVYDEPSRIPEYKVCAVRIERKRPRPSVIGGPPIPERGT